MPAAELRKAVLLGWHESGSLELYLVVKGTTFLGKFILALTNLMDSSFCLDHVRGLLTSTIVMSKF